jgi:hypothetical protein
MILIIYFSQHKLIDLIIYLNTFVMEENELKCYFCLSDDHNYGDCNDDHAGEIVTCQFENPEGEHYGRTCAVGHTGEFEINK